MRTRGKKAEKPTKAERIVTPVNGRPIVELKAELTVATSSRSSNSPSSGSAEINRLYVDRAEFAKIKAVCGTCGSHLDLNDEKAFVRHPSLEIRLVDVLSDNSVSSSKSSVDNTKEEEEPTDDKSNASSELIISPSESVGNLPSIVNKSDRDDEVSSDESAEQPQKKPIEGEKIDKADGDHLSKVKQKRKEKTKSAEMSDDSGEDDKISSDESAEQPQKKPSEGEKVGKADGDHSSKMKQKRKEKKKSAEMSDDSDSELSSRRLKKRFALSDIDKFAEGKSKKRRPVITSSSEDDDEEETVKEAPSSSTKAENNGNRLLLSPTSSLVSRDEPAASQELGSEENDSDADPVASNDEPQLRSILEMIDDNFDVQMDKDDPNFVDRPNPERPESPEVGEVPDSQPMEESQDTAESGDVVSEEADEVNNSEEDTAEAKKSDESEVEDSPQPPKKKKSDEFDDVRKLLGQMPRMADSPDGQKKPKWTRSKNSKRVPVVKDSDEEGEKEVVIDTYSSPEEVVDISSDEEESKSSCDSSDEFKKAPPKRATRQSRSEVSKSSKVAKKPKKKVVKRKRVVNTSSDDSSEDEAKKKGSDEEVVSRRKIRRILDDKKLTQETREAEIAEAERKKRLKERQREYNYVDQVEDTTSPVKTVKITKLILEKDKKGETIVEVNKNLVELLKPHQADGIKFMYDSTIESVEKADESGGGCILAHCMGLGKTLQVIAFIHTVLTNPKLKIKTCLVVAPLNTVLNWAAEFTMWLREKTKLKNINVWEMSAIKDPYERAKVCDDWIDEGGVLVMGYQMYQRLSRGLGVKSKRVKTILSRTLVDPGPDMVFCDEGHMLKNEKTALSQAMNAIRTQRRVVLTGTPLQNNLNEYHCMVNFVKPNLLGTKKEFLNRFVNPIKCGQHADSNAREVSVMKRRAHVLHDLLEGIVQRKDYNCLVKFLPQKNEYVLKLLLSDKQIELYQLYLNKVVGRTDADALRVRRGLFGDFSKLQRVWTHPYTLHMQQERADKVADRKEMNDEINDFVATSDEEVDGDDDIIIESDSDSEKRKKKKRKQKGPTEESAGSSKAPVDLDGSNSEEEVVRNYTTRSRRDQMPEELVRGLNNTPPCEKIAKKHWWSDYIDLETARFNAEMSGKMMMLMEIIRKCEDIGDKLLVFSQSLVSLTLIEDFLRQYDDAGWQSSQNALAAITGERWGWEKGVDYYRMDGGTNAENRKDFADEFNDKTKPRARLFLISTKAGSLGINLVGANRVIIFDASWNPSHDVQSIFRVYRFGQKKPVNVYRFIAAGTMEEKIYDRQVTKQSLAARVLDEQQIERHFTSADLEALYTLDLPDKEKRPTPIVPKDRLLADLLQSRSDWLYDFHEHDSLLQDIEEEKLTETERRAAWEEYDNVKAGRLYLPPPPTANQAQMLHNLAMAQAQTQFLNATAALQQTPGQVLGELVRAGQYFLDRSGEACEYTMRQVVEGIQNQYFGNPEGLVEKTRQIVEMLRLKVLEKQQRLPGTGATPLAERGNVAGPSGGSANAPVVLD